MYTMSCTCKHWYKAKVGYYFHANNMHHLHAEFKIYKTLTNGCIHIHSIVRSLLTVTDYLGMTWPALYFGLASFLFMMFINIKIHSRTRPFHTLFVVSWCIETKLKVQQATDIQQYDDYSALFMSQT